MTYNTLGLGASNKKKTVRGSFYPRCFDWVCWYPMWKYIEMSIIISGPEYLTPPAIDNICYTIALILVTFSTFDI